MTDKPQFTHDCNRCVFLGTYEDHDLYYHPGGPPLETVIARWSSDGPDYASGLIFAEQNPLLEEALRRAIEKGLTK